jgi:hypothetical protein
MDVGCWQTPGLCPMTYGRRPLKYGLLLLATDWCPTAAGLPPLTGCLLAALRNPLAAMLSKLTDVLLPARSRRHLFGR